VDLWADAAGVDEAIAASKTTRVVVVEDGGNDAVLPHSSWNATKADFAVVQVLRPTAARLKKAA